MASTREVEVPLRVRLVVDDRTRAALVALGWTPPANDSEPQRYVPKATPGMNLPLIDDVIDMAPDPLLSEPQP